MTTPPIDLPALVAGAEVRAAGTAPLRVAVARTAAEHQRGLMFRTALGGVDGMLFVMARPDYHACWMLHVRLALDLAWIDGRGTVVDVAAAVPPCEAPPCRAYEPRATAKYVLEVPAGALASHGIARGGVVAIVWLTDRGAR